MSNLWQETSKLDSPWNSDQDGWGTPSDSWAQKSSEPSTDWSANSGWTSSTEASSEPQDAGGWGLDEPVETHARKTPPTQSEHAWDAPAEEASWLSAGPSPKEELFAPRWEEVKEPDEDWLDEEDEELSGLPEGEPVEAVGGGGLWLAVVALGLLTVFGLWSLNRKETKPTLDPQVAAIAEALDSGRLLVEAGQLSLKEKKAENSASQLRKAVEQLEKGEAPVKEIWTARRLLGRATFRAGQLEESHAVWSQLATQKEYRAEAALAVREIAVDLRKTAVKNLDQAGALLAQGDFKGAESLAQKSLMILAHYGGNDIQIGRAYSAAGSALAKQGRLSSARAYFRKAEKRCPTNAAYRAARIALGGGPVDELAEVEPLPLPASSSPASASITSEADYPSGQQSLAGGGSGTSKNPVTTASDTGSSASTRATGGSTSSSSNGGGKKPKSEPVGKLGGEGVVDTYRDGPVGGGSAY